MCPGWLQVHCTVATTSWPASIATACCMLPAPLPTVQYTSADPHPLHPTPTLQGIIFQGPPGTGKTYLARAIAGEAGLTFLSAVGSEFVEMFAGVAAARVNSLYHTARKKAPCIIFIDEMDAIGRSRTQLGGDPGSIERESALLSMLVQMDGINGKLEQVSVYGGGRRFRWRCLVLPAGLVAGRAG